MITALDLNHINFTHPSAPDPLFEGVSAQFPRGWTALLGDNGIGKTTLVRLAVGALRPDSGTVSPATSSYAASYCPQRLDEPPANLDDFASDWSPETQAVRNALGIGDDWCWRWDTLSGGEAKRLQLACAFAARPDVLVLDEPTNHVDAPTRDAIAAAMRLFDGVGIVVSHDTALIDATCARCVMLERRHVRGRNVTVAVAYQGGYAQASAQRKANDSRDAEALAEARRAERRIAGVRAQRAEHARELDARKRRGDRIDPRDHDSRNRLKYGKPTLGAAASRAAAQLDGRLDEARRAVGSLSVAAKRYGGGIWMGTEPSHRRELLHVAAGVIRYGDGMGSGSSPRTEGASPRAELAVRPHDDWTMWTVEETDPNGDGLLVPELSVGPRDHIMVAGPNGLGKTTLIRALLGGLEQPVREGFGIAGTDVPTLAVGQRTGADAERKAMAALAGLHGGDRARALSVYARLNADPDRLLADSRGGNGGHLSPGELRKLMLALGAVRGVRLIVMDEPTNHLDLGSKEALARMLRDFPGAVVLATHDALLLGS
ncbi:ATP-binding cassette domain-containing protein [Bifidobacterium avesanii]|uniref:ATP-binding cassette domain-containing protein n=1 Tax=Bifidobacterium avesanii TaxID=1798157 RepID=A0A7K3TES1_9BIFI|nr:ATP-binding cassette domain-containing protein [Bifidobacterium avesanii]KAB8295583.1 ABC transporter [Bifidobacterium avesanii]NEG77587.1 ATP-binding cassette domain-containing protein [Bifidobacterium avesanii]